MITAIKMKASVKPPGSLNHLKPTKHFLLNRLPLLMGMKERLFLLGPFITVTKKFPMGVVAVSFTLSKFAEIAQRIGVGPTGFTYMLTQDGTFLIDPVRQDLELKKTLYQFAQEQGDDELARIALKIQKGEPILENFYNKTTQSNAWMYSERIPISGWTIVTVFKDSEIGLAVSVERKYIFSIVSYALLIVMLAVALFCIFTNRNFNKYLYFSNFFLFATICTLWLIIYFFPASHSSKNILVTDSSSVARFVAKQDEEAARMNEPRPIPIQAGIEIYSLEQTSPKQITFSGYIWHRYHKELHKDILRSIRVPQAINFTLQRELKLYEGDWEIIAMDVNLTLYQEHDYSHYPFDPRHFTISLEHADLLHNTIMVPDVGGYTNMLPKTLPGIDHDSNNAVRKTYFDFVPQKPNADLGVRSYLDRSSQYRLGYNIIMRQDILGPFIFFFFPLLVILISIFAVLILEQRKTDAYTLIGPYTGLFFSLVLLHRSLHESAPSSQILYIEYAFFFTYVTIIVLVTHTILTQKYSESDFYQVTVTKFLKHAFWPMQLMSWIITTLLMFY